MVIVGMEPDLRPLILILLLRSDQLVRILGQWSTTSVTNLTGP